MKFSRLIETMIKEAIERGVLKNLPGEGKPLKLKAPNAFESKEENLFAYIMKSSGELPVEIILLKEIETVNQKLEKTNDDTEKNILKKKLKELTLKYEIQMEARRHFFLN